MRRSRWFAGFFLFAFATCVPALAQVQLKLFVGYSYIRPSVTYEQASACPAGCPVVPGSITKHLNLNGYDFSATYKFLPFVGVSADFSGQYGTVTGSSSGHLQTYLLGPELAFPAKVSPFVHGLIGIAHQAVAAGTSFSNGVPVDVFSASDNAFPPLWAAASICTSRPSYRFAPSSSIIWSPVFTPARKISRALLQGWSCASEEAIARPNSPPPDTGAATSRFVASSGAKVLSGRVRREIFPGGISK